MEGVGGDGDGLPSPLQGEVERKMGCFTERKGRINGVQWREWRGSKGSGLQGCLAGGRSHLRLCVLDRDGALRPGEGRSQATSFSRSEPSSLKRHHLAATPTPNTLTPSPHTRHTKG